MSDAASQAAEQMVRGTIAGLTGVPVGDLDDEVLIRDDLGVDSLRALEIIAACERALNIEIDEQVCANHATVGEFVSYVASVWHSTNQAV